MTASTAWLRLPVEDLDDVVDAVGPRWQRLRNQRLLLTGGTGFIGKWLLATLLHANRRKGLGAKVVVLSRRPSSFLAAFPELHEAPEIEWYASDVRELVPAVAAECAYAIHAATDVIAAGAAADTLDTCITGTKRVMQAMACGEGLRRVLMLSSGAVYGRVPAGMATIPESWMGGPDPLAPSSAYAEGKRVSELLCTLAADSCPGLEVTVARGFAFVGPHLPLDKHFAIGNFIRSAMRGEDICIQGDGTPLRSYLYAADLAHWLWVMLFDAPSTRAYNIGGAESLSIRDLAHRVNRVLGGGGAVRVAQMPKTEAPPQTYVPSIERISQELGLRPTFSLDEAIVRTARWSRHHLPRPI